MSEEGGIPVVLTPEQIAFIRASLDYSARAFREYDYGADEQMREFGVNRRAEAEATIASIRAALSGEAD